MTRITRKLTRETAATFREQGKQRAVIISLEPGAPIVTLRLKGCRRVEQTTIEAVYDMAVKARVRAERQEKSKQRRSR